MKLLSITTDCCFCKKNTVNYGNNPAPLMDGELYSCCDDCNVKLVIPSRILIFNLRKLFNL
jgi:hypothetical protein